MFFFYTKGSLFPTYILKSIKLSLHCMLHNGRGDRDDRDKEVIDISKEIRPNYVN